MSEMVERVAAAICEARHQDWSKADRSREFYRVCARAAIAAMREPTEEMLEAPNYWGYSAGKEIWTTMIDAALEPVDDDVDERVGGKAK